MRTDWVYIPAVVTDSDGRPIEGLKKQDFRLLEDGVPQELSDVFIQDGPISVGIVFDGSNSMRDKMNFARDAVSQFLKLSAREDDYFLVTFQDKPRLHHGFTNQPEFIEENLKSVQPKGWTALFDAMYLALDHMKQGKWKRRVLFVVSDGGDNNSRYTESELRRIVRESDVRIFSISIKARTPSLEKLAIESGGRAYRAEDFSDLNPIASTISREAHSEYVLGFVPADRMADGKYHSVKVELVPAKTESRWRLSWRQGYYSQLE
jgi:Ca-activated chloride channel family protein